MAGTIDNLSEYHTYNDAYDRNDLNNRYMLDQYAKTKCLIYSILCIVFIILLMTAAILGLGTYALLTINIKTNITMC
jgi:hypothetical protein